MPRDNCVECGYPKDRHDENGNCPGSAGRAGKRYATMALPEGRTCADCRNLKKFCGPVIGYKGDETSCDYFPVRFVAIVTAPVTTEVQAEVRS